MLESLRLSDTPHGRATNRYRLTGLLGTLVSRATETFPRALPKIRLDRMLSELKVDRPIWMEEFNGRFFVVEQQGRIVVTPKGGDGKEAKDFLNIVTRKPYVDNEEGFNRDML